MTIRNWLAGLRAHLATIRTRLVDPAWWRAAFVRAAWTVAAVALPYFGGSLISEVPWLTLLSAGGLAAVTSLLTSIAGLPEAEGTDLPWWLAAVERTVKTFAQALVAGFGGAVLLTDVDWAFVLQASVLATLGTLLRLILATLPADPTVGTAPPARNVHQTIVLPKVDAEAIEAAVDYAATHTERFPEH